MVKKITSLNIDSEVVQQAKERGINMSEIAESAIKKKIGIQEVNSSEDVKFCPDCQTGFDEGMAEIKGVTWLCPDEHWICNNCLRYRISKIPIANR